MEEEVLGISGDDFVSPDFTELETSIKDLVETLEKDLETKEKEKIEQKEKEQQTIEDDLLNEEKLQEDQTLDQEYKQNMVSLQEDQATGIENLTLEIQALNENTLNLIEKTDVQNDLIIEGSLTLIIAIVIVASIKVFIDQVTKW